MLTPAEDFARCTGKWFWDRDFNAGPSHLDKKRFWLPWNQDRYAEYWTEKFPEWIYGPEHWPATTNLQAMTGVHWRLLVIDLDSPSAIQRWDRMGRTPRTWVSHSGGGGRHVWFSLPRGFSDPLPKRFLWKGPEKHEAIERLCDNSLIMCPPSYHPTTGRQYKWLDKGHSPLGMGRPCEVPDWVLRLKPIEREAHVAAMVPPRPRVMTRAVGAETFLSRDEILDRIPDKVGLASGWGIRFTGRVSASGWAECHAIGRPDHVPSAALNIYTGVYTSDGGAVSMSLFDTMVATGHALDFPDATARLSGLIR